MNQINEKFRFYAHALVLELIDLKEVNGWLFEVIEQNDLDDIPDDFFELVYCDQKHMLNYILEQRLTSTKSVQQARNLFRYYLDRNQLILSDCLLDLRHYKNLFNIASVFDLSEVYTSLSLLHDDYYVNYVYPDKNTAEFKNFLDDIWLKILNV